ncbi:MAG: glycosyltransferase [Patescibacteria group bacterium]
MKIALVHDHLNSYGGGERVLEYLSQIWPEAPIYCLTYDPKNMPASFHSKDIRPSWLNRLPGMPKFFKWYLPLMPKAIESFDFSDFDVVLSDTSSFAKGVITHSTTKHICYLFTPTRYLTSDRVKYLKDAPIPRLIKPLMPLILGYLGRWDRKAAHRPDYLIAISRYIAQRSRRFYQRDPDQIIWPPVDSSFFRPSNTLGDYFLVVCRQEPYKRTDLAILAANQLGLKLKVVGRGRLVEEYKKIAGPTVEFVGFVSDKELAKLYSHCLAFIFPPEEDAGMTPLEAMASGRPVIAYGAGGALESVVDGVTGLFFAHQTVRSLVGALRSFDPGQYDSKKIRAHALRFDKKIFQSKIRRVVEEQINQPSLDRFAQSR